MRDAVKPRGPAGPAEPAHPRRSGILVHPTSLPGPFGVGDLGPASLRFLDWVAEAGFRVWQVLPLGPPGPGDSPYSALSAFAGNPLLISPRLLVLSGWLPAESLDGIPSHDPVRVDYPRATENKTALLREAWARFRSRGSGADRRAFEEFREHPDQLAWLEDWSLFVSLKQRFGRRSWVDWDPDLRSRRAAALRAARRDAADEMDYQRWLQFVFFRQWSGLRRAAHARGISLMGDAPYYVAADSVDVWMHQDLFQLDERGHSLKIAGVPPDYFSATGQLWGNPIYRWERLRESGYSWWVERVRANLRLVDHLRLDHFRGFAAYWEVDAGEPTAEHGRWVAGPGLELFRELRRRLGDLPLIAEDLGLITDDVEALRDELGLPGMVILQFLCSEDGGAFDPGVPPRNSVIYTGTHDNDTALGWFRALDEERRRKTLRYFGASPENLVRRMVEAAFEARSVTAVVPLQDVLELGTEARMNRPGRPDGNWAWRVAPDALTLRLAERMRVLASSTDRVG